MWNVFIRSHEVGANGKFSWTKIEADYTSLEDANTSRDLMEFGYPEEVYEVRKARK